MILHAAHYSMISTMHKYFHIKAYTWMRLFYLTIDGWALTKHLIHEGNVKETDFFNCGHLLTGYYVCVFSVDPVIVINQTQQDCWTDFWETWIPEWGHRNQVGYHGNIMLPWKQLSNMYLPTKYQCIVTRSIIQDLGVFYIFRYLRYASDILDISDTFNISETKLTLLSIGIRWGRSETA